MEVINFFNFLKDKKGLNIPLEAKLKLNLPLDKVEHFNKLYNYHLRAVNTNPDSKDTELIGNRVVIGRLTAVEAPYVFEGKVTAKDISIGMVGNFTRFPDEWVATEKLNLYTLNNLKTLDNLKTFPKIINITECNSLIALPPNMKLKELNLKDLRYLTHLPRNLNVGILNINNCDEIEEFPDDMKVGEIVFQTFNMAHLRRMKEKYGKNKNFIIP